MSQSAEESLAIWKGRKGAFGAIGRISPDYLCMDGVIPTSRLPDVLRRIGEMSDAYGLKVANIFHAGDGNLHPLIMFDANDPESFHKAEEFGADILKLCVEVGGCLTGEHGVGVEKRELMPVQFTAQELEQQRRIKSAFDPGWLLNPNKVFPLAETVERRARPNRRSGGCRRHRSRRRANEPLAVAGNGTKPGMLRPVQAARSLSTRNLTGITLYSPQRTDHLRPRRHAAGARSRRRWPSMASTSSPNRPTWRRSSAPHAPQTLGGVVATNLSGPRRVAWGAMRDHVLGVRAVTGHGEVIHSGGRVLKNVTGLDLCKLLAGSHGTLGVITEVTLKVLPAPEAIGTLVLPGLDAAAGVAALSAALGSPYSVSGAAWLPREAAARVPALAGFGGSVALVRIEDFAPRSTYRTARLRDDLRHAGRRDPG